MPRIDQETERAQGRGGRVSMSERGARASSRYDQARGASRTGKSRRGFAAMSPELQRQIARKGGQASARVQRRDAFGQFSGGRSRSARSSGRSTARARSR